ncbi:FAD-dependent oxidoreductase [Corynebacterium comes]|uniref:Cytochrome b6-f complex iron-sulfur subunit n=1 Tax=Corynebacterium comes TaxID=2675218 RepID=A0A6B8VYW8_9CORY|nr:FAD-dependent oxidoreductase [Corynebacterium comes]QGU04245.1 Cytochrome b6-f complex iron-sulfur subunit [Corynebacterium comes]
MSRPLWRDNAPPYPTSPLPTGSHVDVAVVGAGFTGLITALLAAEAGLKVAVIEALIVGAGASGATTAKATLLQGTRLSNLTQTHNQELAADYLAANRAGLSWLRDFCGAHGVYTRSASAFTFAATEKAVAQVEAEHRVAQALGLPTVFRDTLPTPFPVHAAVELPDQLQLNPVELLAALVRAVHAAGGTVTERARVTGVQAGEGRVQLTTGVGSLTAGQVVLATASPILDRRVTTMELIPQRSYLCAFDPAPTTEIPAGMYISAESPTFSFRTHVHEGRTKLLVGGQGHRTGKSHDTGVHIETLTEWTMKHFPGARRTHAWSAQDYHPVRMVPHVGPLHWGDGRILFAGGYSKWGLAAAPAAALQLLDLLQGRPAELTFGSPSVLGTAKTTVTKQVWAPVTEFSNLAHVITGSGTRAGDAPDGSTTDDNGAVVFREGVHLVGESSVDGRACRVSLVCPHMGGTPAWNETEKSWDCPLHGSRFAADGTLIEGPAVRGLKQL